MKGDVPIAAKLSGDNPGSKALADVINRIGKKLDREWVVKAAGEGEESKFLGSEENVTLLLNAAALASSGGGNSMTFRVCVGGVATDVIVTTAVFA